MEQEISRTAKANASRISKADTFALKIVAMLDEVEGINDYTFRSLRDRCVALNCMQVETRRGGEWTKTQMSRILRRVDRLQAITTDELEDSGSG